MTKDYHETLMEQLAEALEPEGFVRSRLRPLFIRRQDQEWSHLLYVLPVDEAEGIQIHVQAGIRCETVEALFHHTSGFASDKQSGTVTVGTDCWRLGTDFPRS